MRRVIGLVAVALVGCAGTRGRTEAPVAAPSPAAAAGPATAVAPERQPAAPTTAKTPADFGLRAYDPDAADPFPDGWAEVEGLAEDDIAPTFDNLDDLAWLVPVARAHEVVLFGEDHYHRVIHHLAHRVLFALQQGDHYHLLTIEMPYSQSPYLDHYVQLTDDAAAAAFRAGALAPYVDHTELGVLLDRVRAWNLAHPRRRIHLAAHDIEHDVRTTIEGVLAPYLRRVDADADLDVAAYEADPDQFFTEVDALVARARKARLIGDHPFLTAEFIATVVANLRSIHHARRFDFTYYRQRAIVRNLTDPRFLGRWFRTGKVMLWGGSYHTPTRRRFPDGGEFLREGAYLSQTFAPTRGKTYSIQVTGIALSLGDMANVDPATLGHVGDGYGENLRRLQRAYAAGALDPDQAYLLDEPSAMSAGAAALARKVDHRPFRITSISWGVIGLVLPRLPADVQRAVRDARELLDSHDAFIIVPRSPLIRYLPLAGDQATSSSK